MKLGQSGKISMFEKVLYRLEIIESFVMNICILFFKENDNIYRVLTKKMCARF